MRKSESDLLCQHPLFTRAEERTLDGKPSFKLSLCNIQLRQLKRPWYWKASKQSPAHSGPQHAGFQTSHLNGVLSQQLSKRSQARPDTWTMIITLRSNSLGIICSYIISGLVYQNLPRCQKDYCHFHCLGRLNMLYTDTILSWNTTSCIS